MLGRWHHLKGLIEVGRVISELSKWRHTLPPRLILWTVPPLAGDDTINTTPELITRPGETAASDEPCNAQRVCARGLLVPQPRNCPPSPSHSSSGGVCVQPPEAESPARAEDALLGLQAADPPHSRWQKQNWVCTAVGRLNVGGFKLGRIAKTVCCQKTCCQWVSTYLVFLLHLNTVLKVWEFQWLMAKHRPALHKEFQHKDGENILDYDFMLSSS